MSHEKDKGQLLTDCNGVPLPDNAALITKVDVTTGIGINTSKEVSPLNWEQSNCPTVIFGPDCNDPTLLPHDQLYTLDVVSLDGNGGMSFTLNKSTTFAVEVNSPPNPVLNYSVQSATYWTWDGAQLPIDFIDLPTPARCDKNDIYIKNICPIPGQMVQIRSPQLIDGQPFITLDGFKGSGAYPFGNDGGESVHLVYDDFNATWRVW